MLEVQNLKVSVGDGGWVLLVMDQILLGFIHIESLL